MTREGPGEYLQRQVLSADINDEEHSNHSRTKDKHKALYSNSQSLLVIKFQLE